MKIIESMKLIHENNTLKNEIETLKETIKEGLYEQFFKDLNKLENYEKLKEDNKRLREKNKALKETLNEGRRNRSNKSKKCNARE